MFAANSYDREPEFPIPRVVARSSGGATALPRVSSARPTSRSRSDRFEESRAAARARSEGRTRCESRNAARSWKRAGGEASVDIERRPAGPPGVPNDEALAGVHGGVDYKVAGSGHLGTVDLDIPVRDEAEISGILARTICVGQVVLHDDALRRIDGDVAVDDASDAQFGTGRADDVRGPVRVRVAAELRRAKRARRSRSRRSHEKR